MSMVHIRSNLSRLPKLAILPFPATAHLNLVPNVEMEGRQDMFGDFHNLLCEQKVAQSNEMMSSWPTHKAASLEPEAS